MEVTIKVDDESILVPSEVATYISQLEKKNRHYEVIIADMENLHIDAVNDLLRLSREIDTLTDVAFSNPMFHAREHRV